MRFKVGCDCIRKTGDRGLVRFVTEQEAEKRREKSRAIRVRKASESAESFKLAKSGDAKLFAALAEMPHPKFRAGETAADYVRFCVDNPRFWGELAVSLVRKATK